MNLQITSVSVAITESREFNWVKVAFWMEVDRGNDFLSTIEIRVPNTIANLDDIRAYALDKIRKFDLSVL